MPIIVKGDPCEESAPQRSTPCVCERLPSKGPCFYCRTSRSTEERKAFIQTGVERMLGSKAKYTKEDFEEERKRLQKKSRRKKRSR